MLTAFCLVVLFIFCGLLLGLIETTRTKSAEKKARLIDGRGIIGKKEFVKMVNKEAKKGIKNI